MTTNVYLLLEKVLDLHILFWVIAWMNLLHALLCFCVSPVVTWEKEEIAT